MKNRKIVCFFLFLSIIFSLGSCKEEVKPQSYTYFDFFDTVITVSDYSGLSKNDFNALLDIVKEEVSEYHELYDIYNEYHGKNNIATINKLAGKNYVKVDSKIIDLLSYSIELYNMTDGKINIAMGSVLSMWHKYREEKISTPPYLDLISAAMHTDISSIEIDKDTNTVKIKSEKCQIDVGAIAKGYAEERIAEKLISLGYTGIVLDFGGNLRAIGTKLDGGGWTTGIKNPNNPYGNEYSHTLTIANEALATSGVYERYYTVDGKNYHHIIDPATLFPSERYLSLSVKSKRADLYDALSTAFFNMTIDDIQKIINENRTVTVYAIDKNGVLSIIEPQK